jgi:hypothetical protein
MAGYGQDGIDRIGAGCRLLQQDRKNGASGLEGLASLPRNASVHEPERIAQATSAPAVDLQQLVSPAC